MAGEKKLATGAAGIVTKLVPEMKDFTAAGIVELLFGGKGGSSLLGQRLQQASGSFFGMTLDDEAAAMEIQAQRARQELEMEIIVEKKDDKGKAKKEKVRGVQLSVDEINQASKNFDAWLNYLPKHQQNRLRQIMALTKKRDDLTFLFVKMGRMQDNNERTKFAMSWNWITVSVIAALAQAIRRLPKKG